MKFSTTLFSFLLLLQTSLSAQVFIGDTEVDTTTIITGLDIPWEIQWGPDGQIWTTERFGRISRIDPITGIQDVILDISDQVYQNGESGLLGMVLHPDFENEPFVYTAYTYNSSGSIFEKIVRYTFVDGELQNEFILLDNIQGNSTHDGCRMIILPDNTLLLTTGDAQNQPAAQNINHLSGKTLRLNLDGTIPADNPFPGNPVYSFGHRNPQGLFYGPNGIIYSSEHGPSTDDELNIIEAGENYGWPNVHGFCDLPAEKEFCDANDVVEPLLAWTPTVAASDIVYYDHDAIPEWKDHILMTTLKNKRIYDLELDENGTAILSEQQFFTNWWGRLRDILVGPDGEIYLATSGENWSNTDPFTHGIVKIQNPEYVSSGEVKKPNVHSIKLFPNPVKENLQIAIGPELVPAGFQLLTLEGNLIYDSILSAELTNISTLKFPNGFYLTRIKSKDGTSFSQKIIINN
jgi:glucose/arabinose dehydrogenase